MWPQACNHVCVPENLWSVFSNGCFSVSASLFQIHTRRAFPPQSPSLWSWCLQVAWMWSGLWWFPVIPQVSKSHALSYISSLFVLVLGRLHILWPPATQRHYRCSWLLFLSVGARVGPLLTGVLWRGLLLRTAWASNSCDKCSTHGDGGHFSQTNNGRMFICGSPHLGSTACLPLSLDRGIGVCVFDCLAQLFLSLSQWFVCPPPPPPTPSFLMLYFFVLFLVYSVSSFYCTTPQYYVCMQKQKMYHVYCTYRASPNSASPAV